MPLPSPSEGPTLFLAVLAGVVPFLPLPSTSCAAGQPVPLPAGRAFIRAPDVPPALPVTQRCQRSAGTSPRSGVQLHPLPLRHTALL